MNSNVLTSSSLVWGTNFKLMDDTIPKRYRTFLDIKPVYLIYAIKITKRSIPPSYNNLILTANDELELYELINKNNFKEFKVYKVGDGYQTMDELLLNIKKFYDDVQKSKELALLEELTEKYGK